MNRSLGAMGASDGGVPSACGSPGSASPMTAAMAHEPSLSLTTQAAERSDRLVGLVLRAMPSARPGLASLVISQLHTRLDASATSRGHRLGSLRSSTLGTTMTTRTGRTDIPDLSRSVFLDPLPADPTPPPGW
jgi:hypothetical protein